jgi:hypothetical protein
MTQTRRFPMIEKPLDTEFGCKEYCEPGYKACIENEGDDARCEEKHDDCMAFCQFA